MNAQLQNLVLQPPSTGIPVDSGRRLRLISYNIQVGIACRRYHHYLTQSWKHVLPHAESLSNLDRIARLVNEFDVVALQEADAGSFRSSFVNQVEFLARRGGFPHWYYQTNRNLGKIAQHSNGLLSRHAPMDIVEHRLPGLIPGRGLMEVHYGSGEQPLVLLMVHLGLSKRARMRQILYIARLVNRYRHVVVMGDFNCHSRSEEISVLTDCTRLRRPADDLPTFPSWRPNRSIDHVLVSSSITLNDVQVLPHPVSDHLPIGVDISLPADVSIDAMAHEPLTRVAG
ncbi:MAG: endonuclease/exonuclease/phosphatase family protein [Gammaproteobacteria bacterium]|jgi:endonuclease/exonuclease/phosphatase family metal-dependent hydrolase|nr:endonuclease/exonuclease/phosphatase family protein [Gammaproteobacteria bacterium]